jgi:hypothetical protein
MGRLTRENQRAFRPQRKSDSTLQEQYHKRYAVGGRFLGRFTEESRAHSAYTAIATHCSMNGTYGDGRRRVCSTLGATGGPRHQSQLARARRMCAATAGPRRRQLPPRTATGGGMVLKSDAACCGQLRGKARSRVTAGTGSARLSAIMCSTSSAVRSASGQSQLPLQSLSTSGLSL